MLDDNDFDDGYISFEGPLHRRRDPRKITQLEIKELQTLATRIRNRAKARIEGSDRELNDRKS